MKSSGAPVAIVRDGLPDWLLPVRRAAETVRPEQLSRFLPPAEGGRHSAVLLLFGDGPGGPDLLLTQRSTALRSHPGQVSFPGGSLDPVDGDPAGPGPVAAALREAAEETGLDPAGVQVFATLPALYIPVSDFVVTPVLGWWREESPVTAVDPAETGEVFRVPLAALADPAHRGRYRHPSGFTSPAFQTNGHLVWGFTAGVIDRLLHHSGLEQPWDSSRLIEPPVGG
ncbi:8-oxo-dGTP pyrophosphatase MutT (NUDIX family) [Kitasatospora sp. GP30]|uniref:NUDIX hydrolase n=1 Tax=Kitasatospora sp. GP30 TaxID=3035084 RepID=UPI000C6FE459|nr:CoA pyrophosphatase [Kitasatospora sp. GP30]MDH6138284.1 8-oxo-dGTP pyrophosphatase MutT (NUDIX family) [Kitasatospora sp. GP30]